MPSSFEKTKERIEQLIDDLINFPSLFDLDELSFGIDHTLRSATNWLDYSKERSCMLSLFV